MSVEASTAEGWKLALATAAGPASDVSVGAGSDADVDLSVSPGPAVVREVLALRSISGLPRGLAVAGVEYPGEGRVRIRVFNCTASAVTVPANSVSASVLCKAC